MSGSRLFVIGMSVRNVIVCYNTKEFLQYISNKKIMIYGTGYVALNFLEALQKRGLDNRIQGFVVSKKSWEQRDIKGFPIKEIDEIFVSNEIVICIAVHESIKAEVESILLQKGFLHYLWIYPCLYHLYYGDPVKEREWVNIRELIPRDSDRYKVALRWAALEDYYGNCPQGFYLYRKAMALHANMRTVEAREAGFRKLIQNFDEFGYDSEKQIAINEEYEIIDGEHRLTIAFYHGMQKIKCKIYSGENLHNEEVLMSKRVLIEGGFTEKEMDILDNINLTIRDLIS